MVKRVTKTVIFDLGKVLIPFDWSRGYRAMQAHCGLTPEQIRARIAATGLVRRFETGQMEPLDFVAQLTSLLDLNVSYERFREIWSSIFVPDPLIPESMLSGLRERYRLLLLSNTNAIHFDMVRANYPMLRHFDDFILSYEVKAMKPAPAIYQAAIEQARCKPEECFYTDDIADFVEGARRVGMDAVQFESRPQLEREMAAREIRWS